MPTAPILGTHEPITLPPPGFTGSLNDYHLDKSGNLVPGLREDHPVMLAAEDEKELQKIRAERAARRAKKGE